jgi:hypothetical protein
MRRRSEARKRKITNCKGKRGEDSQHKTRQHNIEMGESSCRSCNLLMTPIQWRHSSISCRKHHWKPAKRREEERGGRIESHRQGEREGKEGRGVDGWLIMLQVF